MTRFTNDPHSFFSNVYQSTAPWDIGGAQPAMAAMLEKHPPVSPILDVGCGSGDLAIYLAQMGYTVVGIDFIEAAIAGARAKVDGLGPEVAGRLTFQVADALKPSLLGRRFGAVVDSGFYHLFNPDQGAELIDEIASILMPNGRYYLHEFAIEFPVPNVPRAIYPEELRGIFTVENGWNILEIQSVEFLSRVAPPVAGTCACVERGGVGLAP